MHVKKMLSKMKTQINILHRTTVSIWKVTFTRIHHIYSAVIRSVLVYEAAVWHVFISVKSEMWQFQSSAVKLKKMQNKCLQTVAEIYRAISITVVKTEIYTSSLSIYLDFKVTSFYRYYKNAEMKKIITATCNKIHCKLDYKQSQTFLIAEER